MIPRLVSYIGASYLYLVGKTSFTRNADDPAYLVVRREKRPVVYAFWHNNQVFLAYEHRGITGFHGGRRRAVAVLVSKSKDGEYIAQVMDRLGLLPVRGSSSRGGEQALREMIGILQDGGQVGFSPDGPKGPAQKVQGGVILAAQVTGRPIVPVAVSFRRQLVFNSWDRFKVPLPFNQIIVTHGKPIPIGSDMAVEQAAEKLRQALDKSQEFADHQLHQENGFIPCLMGRCLLGVYQGLGGFLSPFVVLSLALKFGLKKSVHDFSERWGFHPFPPTDKKRIWFHAASAGEWRALKPVINEFSSRTDLEPVVTVTATIAKRLIMNEAPQIPVRFLPVDFKWVIKRWIRKMNPYALMVVESELWPNLFDVIPLLNIPSFIINGRLSDRSFRRWKWVGPLVSQSLKSFSHIYARTKRDAQFFVGLGTSQDNVSVSGNTKADNLIIISEEEQNHRKRAIFKGRPGLCLIGASTWPGEEQMLIQLFKGLDTKEWRLILAPRKMERLAGIQSDVMSAQLSFQRYSEMKRGEQWNSQILLVDTIGDMKELFSISDVAFIGGSLFPKGGQNPLEAAAARLALVFGPHMSNFEDEAAGMIACGATKALGSKEDIFHFLKLLCADAQIRKKMGELAAAELRRRQGVTKTMVQDLFIKLGIEAKDSR